MANDKDRRGKFRRKMSPGVKRWVSSDEWKAIASGKAKANLAARALLERCGAIKRSDGLPCRQAAMANGRCYWHGGATPRGTAWHRPVFSDGRTPGGTDKLLRKLADLEMARQRRDARLAAMCDAEKARYVKWIRSHSPDRSARLRDRAQGRQGISRLQLEATPPRAPDPELVELDRLIAALKAEASRLSSMSKANAVDEAATKDLGIFG